MSQATRILGCNPLTARYVYSCISFNLNSVFEQSLRWKRKPIWYPTAKSKVFKVPVKPVVPEEEVIEMKRLFNNYRTSFKSLRRHFMRIVKENEVELDPLVLEKAKEDDFQACFAINDEWNKKISIEREERLIKQRELRKTKILHSIEVNKQKKEEEMLKALDEIEKAKELVSTFITNDNIDEAIEETLNNVVDYNYAINVNGHKFSSSELEKMEKEQSAKKVVEFSQ